MSLQAGDEAQDLAVQRKVSLRFSALQWRQPLAQALPSAGEGHLQMQMQMDIRAITITTRMLTAWVQVQGQGQGQGEEEGSPALAFEMAVHLALQVLVAVLSEMPWASIAALVQAATTTMMPVA